MLSCLRSPTECKVKCLCSLLSIPPIWAELHTLKGRYDRLMLSLEPDAALASTGFKHAEQKDSAPWEVLAKSVLAKTLSGDSIEAWCPPKAVPEMERFLTELERLSFQLQRRSPQDWNQFFSAMTTILSRET